MSEEYTAQKRRGNNDTVHVYEDGESTAVCANSYGQPSRNSVEEEFQVDKDEIEDEDYLIRDDEIVGKFCGKCHNIITGELPTG